MLRLLVVILLFCLPHALLYAKKWEANVSKQGFANVESIIFKLGGDLAEIEFVLEFSSDPSIEPSVFGAYWSAPLLSSRIVKTGLDSLEWTTPGSAKFYFYSDRLDKNELKDVFARFSPGKYRVYADNSGEWFAALAKNGDIHIESIGNRSKFFQYRNGLLSKFSNGGDTYSLNYFPGGKAKSLKCSGAISDLVTFKYYPDGVHVAQIFVGPSTYNFEYHDISPSEIMGSGEFGNAKLLKEIKFPDGRCNHFSYSCSGTALRRVVMRDFSVKEIETKVNRMVIDEGAWLKWCAKTGMAVADNMGAYSIGNDAKDVLHPDYDGSRIYPSFVFIEHRLLDGRHPDIYFADYKNLTEIYGNPATGEVLRYSNIGGRGVLRMKPRKVERLKSGAALGHLHGWELVSLNHYNADGKIIREIYKNNSVIEYAYDNSGCLIQKRRDGVPVFKRSVSEGVKYTYFLNDSGKKEIFEYEDNSVKTVTTYSDYKSIVFEREKGNRINIIELPIKEED